MEKVKEVMFIKGKESVVVSFLLLLAIVLFFVPIALVLILRTVYKLIQTAKEQVKIADSVNANFEKVY